MYEEEGQVWGWGGMVSTPPLPAPRMLAQQGIVNSQRPAGLSKVFVLYNSMEVYGWLHSFCC